MKLNVVSAAILAAFCLPAYSASTNSEVSGYFVAETADFDGDSTDGTGFGLAANIAVPVNNMVSIYLPGEYNRVSFDETAIFNPFDLDELRIGAGVLTKVGPIASVYGGARYLSLKIDVDGAGSDDLTGFGIFAGAKGNVLPNVKLYGELQYVSLEDDAKNESTGPEFTLGAQVDFRGPGVFAEYRLTQLEDDTGDADLSSFRIGARYSF